MTIAPKLREYLTHNDADYELIVHDPTASSLQSAAAIRIPAQQLAKGVLLETADDRPLLAVIPADRRVSLDELRGALGSKPRLAREEQLVAVFDDCAAGAVPPLGEGYGVETIVDDMLGREPDLYLEAGDHRSLVHLDRDQFARLTSASRHGSFSERWADMD